MNNCGGPKGRTSSENGWAITGRPMRLLVFVLTLIAAFTFAATAAAEPIAGLPTIWSDKSDYAPGELVTLRGSSWEPGAYVHIVVNDDDGQTWKREVDVAADADGNISDEFNLPEWFVANYSVTATSVSGAIAATSFTDANVTVPSGSTSVDEGQTDVSYTATVSGCSNTRPCGYYWSIVSGNATLASGATQASPGSTSSSTAVTAKLNFGDGPSTVVLRITGTGGTGQGLTSSENLTITVNNVPPAVSFSPANTTNPNEGSTATYDWSTSDAGGDAITALGTPSCGTGTLVGNPSNASDKRSGSFKCKFANGPASTSVSITATDKDGATGTGTQAISIQNVAPSVVSAGAQAAVEGQAKAFDLGSFSDPGAEGSWSVIVNWGDGSPSETFSVSAAGSLGTRQHTYATPGSKTVTVTVSDGTASGAQSFSVSVAPADSTAPTTSASATKATTPSSSYTFGDWSSKDVTVTLSASDNAGGSGVKEITYSASGAQAIASTTVAAASLPASFSVTANGTTTITFFAKDNAGNTEAAQTRTVKIDKVAPAVGAASAVKLDGYGNPAGSYAAGDWTNKDVRVSWSCDDNAGGSGAVKASESQT
ncbi:MAG: PKD domain-containing protein, partial [Actinomycetota bacterium]|nr:PKD domain-containing protein [Actinomycetota bacterium]